MHKLPWKGVCNSCDYPESGLPKRIHWRITSRWATKTYCFNSVPSPHHNSGCTHTYHLSHATALHHRDLLEWLPFKLNPPDKKCQHQDTSGTNIRIHQSVERHLQKLAPRHLEALSGCRLAEPCKSGVFLHTLQSPKKVCSALAKSLPWRISKSCP